MQASPRYSCQVLLPGFGESAQEKLSYGKVLIVGAGGLGCPVAQYLTATGIGTIGIADYDTISESNLHRQFLYNPRELGLKKSLVACKKLQQQNPLIKLIPHDVRITSENVMDIISNYDIIVDGTDNFETRYLLNDAAVLSGKPLVYGAIYQYEGQVAVWNVKNADDDSMSANYRDLYRSVDATQIPNCADGGVIPTLAGIIGCMQANEVIKYFTQSPDLLVSKLVMFDAQSSQSRVIKLSKSSKTTITRLPETETIKTIAAAALQSALKDGIYELVDVRNEEERIAFNIGGKHLPLNKLQTEITTFKPGKPVVIYCASGKRSAEAAKVFKKHFPTLEVLSLEGGLKSWNAS